jgi:hypothetical protein
MSLNELVATHHCVDEDGNQYTVHGYQNFTEDKDFTGKVWRRDTSISFVLANGGEAYPQDDDTFQVLGTGKIIKRIAAYA